MCKNQNKNIFQIILIFFILFFSIFFNLIYGKAIVSGYSMYPTLDNNDFIIYNKNTTPKKGDIVAIKPTKQHNEPLVKRIIATGGDTVKIYNNVLFVNDKQIEEEYLYENDWYSEDLEISLKENEYFVLGDNRNNSSDSRIFGTFQKTDIMGVVILNITDKYNLNFSTIRNFIIIIMILLIVCMYYMDYRERKRV